MAVQMETVKRVISIWNQIFPGVRGLAQLEILEATFYKLMQRSFSDETFLIAADMVLRETKFFPVPKYIFDLRASVYQAWDNRKLAIAQQDCKQLTEDTGNLTPDEIAQNQKRIDIIIRQLSGELSLEEAMEQQAKLTTYVKNT